MGLYGVTLAFLIRYRGRFSARQRWKTTRVYFPLLVLALLPSLFRADLLSHVGGFVGGLLLGLFVPPNEERLPRAESTLGQREEAKKASYRKGQYRHCPYCTDTPVREEVEEASALSQCGFVRWKTRHRRGRVLFEDALVSRFGEAALRTMLPDSAGGPARPGRRRVLLVRRKAPPAGSWCIPCGYVEFDEEIREALAREMREETGLLVEPAGVLAVLQLPRSRLAERRGLVRARPVRANSAPGMMPLSASSARRDRRRLAPTDAQVLRELAQTPPSPPPLTDSP
jgi:ADP-ribose pyrophosphatase YjhB (NUDIX family)